MRAFRCDVCGKEYRPYVKKVGDEIRIEANGISFIRIDKLNKLHGKGRVETCPECMDKIQNYIFDELCAPDAHLIEKVIYYKKKKEEEEASDNE